VGMSAAGCRAWETRTPNPARERLEATVFRPGLVNRLRAARHVPLVVVTAPAGYGKSTLVADWAQRDDRAFTWCHVDEHTHSAVLVERLAAAVAVVADASGDRLTEARGRGRRALGSSVARLLQALGSLHDAVIVLDGIDLVRDTDAAELLAVFADSLGAGSQLALVGRAEPLLPLSRLRARGHLFELGIRDLRFSDREAATLLRNTGLDISASAVRGLNERLDGWPLGLRLAAQSLESGQDELALVRHYFRDELLARLPDGELDFLTRTSVLDRLSGPICDAITGGSGSAAILERFERSNLFLLPLDRERRSYRLHRALREVVLAELERSKPRSAAELRTHASDWCRERGELEAAIGYAHAAHDVDRVAGLVAASVLPFSSSMQPATVERWLAEIDDDALLERNPAAAAVGAMTHAGSGRIDMAERWAAVVARGCRVGAPASAGASANTWSALLHAVLGDRRGSRMQDDADAALAGLTTGSPWRAPPLLTLAEAARLEADPQASDELFAQAAEEAAVSHLPVLRVVALAFRSLLASEASAWDRASSLAAIAESVVTESGLQNDATSACAHVAVARPALRHGDWTTVRRAIHRAEALAARSTDAVMAWLSVEVRLELASIHLALGDAARATAQVDEADAILSRRPQHPGLSSCAREIRAQAAAAASRVDDRPALTAAELRLLPLLTTHLSFQEIADEIRLSRNTVKSQAISVYRKLGVSARGEAIARAAAVGLTGAAAGRS
jgi:LuxR family transcriptional regulator, maltose regulon positive regulatory protein